MACDPYWNKTVLACHFNGTNGSTTFTDECGNMMTAVGGVQISTAQSKFGGASAYFDGDGDFITVPDAPVFDLPGDFTVDAWVYIPSTGGYKTVVSLGSATGMLWVVGGSLKWYTGEVFATHQTLFTEGVWHHVAYVRQSGVGHVYLDGVKATAGIADANAYTPSGVVVGASGSGGGDLMAGYIDDLRITKAARWSENFTPSTTAFTTGQCAISGTVKNSAGNFAAKLVRAFRRDTAALVASSVSNATTGAYSLAIPYDGECFVVAHDSSDNPPSGGTENAVILDLVTPV